MKKNMLIIDNSVSYTGAIKCAINEAKLLSKNANVLFIIPRRSQIGQHIRDEGLQVFPLPLVEIRRSMLTAFLYLPCLITNAFRLQQIIRQHSIDIIQVNDFYNLLGVMIRLLGFKGKLITYVRLLPSSRPYLLRMLWVHLAQRFSDHVIAVSDAVFNQLPAKDNTHRLYDPLIFEEKYTPAVPSEKDEVVLLYLANYIRGKGQDYAIRAFATAYRQNANLRLRFTGSDMGRPKNQKYFEELQFVVESLGLSDVVTFGGFESDIELAIKNSDIVLNFSESESFSMTCAEASYYGKPVIATRCGGPEEIICHGETGLLVESRNTTEMAEAILSLASSVARRQSMGMAARRHVTDKFNVTEYMTFLRQLLHKI